MTQETKRKRGRPAGGSLYPDSITFSMPERRYKEIVRLARAEGKTISQFIRDLIERGKNRLDVKG